MQTAMEAARDIEKLAATHSKRMGEVLGALLKKKYPQLDYQVPPSLNELLAWQLWPNFIKIHGTGCHVFYVGKNIHVENICIAVCPVSTYGHSAIEKQRGKGV